MNLTFEAIDASGRDVSDVIEAPSLREAVEALRRQGLFVTHLARAKEGEIQPRLAGSGLQPGKVRFALRQRVLFTRQMAMLLASGSAVVPALKALARQFKKPDQQALIRGMIADLEAGLPLAEAMSKYPANFDASYCAVVAAGEASAMLPGMFTKLAAMMSKRKAMRTKVLGALAYPALLIVLCTVILSILLFFVIPRFGEMFASLRVPVPTSTAFMLSVSVGLRDWWFVPLGATAAGLVAAVYLVRSAAGRQFLSDVQIRIPLAGRVRSRLIQAELQRVLGMLIEARVGVLESVGLARGVTRNRRYGGLCDEIEGAVTSGNSISSALETSGLFEASICQAVRTGEESGRLGESISYVADVLDEENAELINMVTKLVEPVILIGMGVIVGLVAISLFMPLFDVTAAV